MGTDQDHHYQFLVAISITKYQSPVRQARETVLKDNLFEICRVIKQFIKDRQQAPHSLQNLVEAGYFRRLPIDPMTNSNSSWKPVIETIVVSPEQTDQDITDLHSGSSSISSSGTAYSTW
jgi:general secretion pathway protein G